MELSSIPNEYEMIRQRAKRIANIMLRTIEYNEVKNQEHIEAIMEANGRILGITKSVIEDNDYESAKVLMKSISECACKIVANFGQLIEKESITTDYEFKMIQMYMSETATLTMRAEQIERGLKVYKPT